MGWRVWGDWTPCGQSRRFYYDSNSLQSGHTHIKSDSGIVAPGGGASEQHTVGGVSPEKYVPLSSLPSVWVGCSSSASQLLFSHFQLASAAEKKEPTGWEAANSNGPVSRTKTPHAKHGLQRGYAVLRSYIIGLLFPPRILLGLFFSTETDCPPYTSKLNKMENDDKYLPELLAEKDSLDSSFTHAMKLLNAGKVLLHCLYFCFVVNFSTVRFILWSWGERRHVFADGTWTTPFTATRRRGPIHGSKTKKNTCGR